MFNLTEDERKIILFLLSVALVGIGINFFLKKHSPDKTFACFSQDIGKVNLNTADKDLLMSVPGIGQNLAQRIIDYRRENSGFSSPEELKNIKGITAYRYEKIKSSLCVR